MPVSLGLGFIKNKIKNIYNIQVTLARNQWYIVKIISYNIGALTKEEIYIKRICLTNTITCLKKKKICFKAKEIKLRLKI